MSELANQYPVKTLADVEKEYILHIYAKNNRNKQVTAAQLGISLKTLYNKLNEFEKRQKTFNSESSNAPI